MDNVRLISSNAAKRASSITASTTAGTLTADRLKLGVKSKVWRSTVSTATTLTITLATPELLDCIALAFTNLTAAGMMHVQGYATTGSATAVVDVTRFALVPPSSGNGAESQPTGVNAFSNGGASQGVCWFSATYLQKVVITLTDPTNPAGYIEASCLVMGASWSPRLNAYWGAGVVLKDTTKNERSQSGNLRSDRGTVAKSVSFDLKNLSSTERTKVWGVMLANGLFNPLFVSLYPMSTDPYEEQIHQVYGKLTQQTKLTLQSFGITQATTIEIEEI